MSEVQHPSPVIQAALNQARQARRRGKHRKAMLLMRKAAFEGRENPTLWTRYALSCLRDRRDEEAQKAFAHAVWLDRRQGNSRRARVTENLAEKARRGELEH
jgi:Flp pilus assembly protein TadD